MVSKKRREKGAGGQYLMMLIMMLVGGAFGIYIARYIDNIFNSGKTFGEIVFLIFVIIAVICIALLVQIILHEAGHLFFGRMTGYGFSSFRIGSFMWIKENGTISFRKLTLTGTGGQCLMVPPQLQNGKIPYVLYNMGGAISNMLFSVLFAAIAIITKNIFVVTSLFIALAVIGVGFALVNGIPMRLKMMNNDGYNAISLGKDSKALRSFWIQMKSNELSVKGMRIKDMPEEWFEMPSPEAMKNSMTAVLGVFACNRMMEQMEFEKAERVMRELLQMNTGIIGLYRSLMITDLIYCELVGKNRHENLTKMLNKQHQKFMKSMKSFPSVQRTEYAYALLFERDDMKAKKMKIEFEKTINKYPYEGIIAIERELVAYAERKYTDKTITKDLELEN